MWQDLRWQFIRADRAKDYHGPAVHPRHCSLWEKWVLGIHKQYNPSLHATQKELIKHSMSQLNPHEPKVSGKKLEKLEERASSSDDGQV